MSNLELRKEVRNAVEFWVSPDGKNAGMSLSGLHVLTSVALSNIAKLVSDYINNCKLPTDELEALRSEGLAITDVPLPNGGKPIKFIPAKICAAIITYYACESKRVSPEVKAKATDALSKFAAIGIETWILKVTGYAEAQDNKQVLLLLQQVMLEVQKQSQQITDLNVKVETYNNIRKVTVNLFPGLDNMLDDLADSKTLAPASDLVTAKEWLENKGISLDKPMFHRFTNLVSETYRTMTKQEPRKVSRNNGKGKWTNKYNAFSTDELPILEASLKKLLA